MTVLMDRSINRMQNPLPQRFDAVVQHMHKTLDGFIFLRRDVLFPTFDPSLSNNKKMQSSMTRCSVSSLSLSALSISSDDSSQGSNGFARSGFNSTSTSSLRRSCGSVNLNAMNQFPQQQLHHLQQPQVSQSHSAQLQQKQQQFQQTPATDASPVSTGDEWGYFVDSAYHDETMMMEEEDGFSW